MCICNGDCESRRIEHRRIRHIVAHASTISHRQFEFNTKCAERTDLVVAVQEYMLDAEFAEPLRGGF